MTKYTITVSADEETKFRRIMERLEPEEYTVLELMDMQQVFKALKGDDKAYREILDRLEGRAKQSTEVEISGGMTINWEEKKTYIQNTGSL